MIIENFMPWNLETEQSHAMFFKSKLFEYKVQDTEISFLPSRDFSRVCSLTSFKTKHLDSWVPILTFQQVQSTTTWVLNWIKMVLAVY